MISLALLVFCITTFIIWYFLVKETKTKHRPPGPKGFPILGNFLALGKTPHLTYQKWAKEYGPITYLNLGVKKTLLLSDGKIIREAFSSQVFNGRPDSKVLNLRAQGKHGVMSSDGEEWKEQRRFVLRNLRDLGFGKHALDFIISEEVDAVTSWIKENLNAPISVEKRFVVAVVNAFWRIMIGQGHKSPSQEDSNLNNWLVAANDAFNDLMEGSYLMFLPQLSKILPKWFGWHPLEAAIKPLTDLFESEVTQHANNMTEYEEPRDLVDMYLKEMGKVKDPNSSFYKSKGRDSIRNVIADFYFAGSVTMSTTLNWSVLYLMLHPEIQEKLYQELDDVLGKDITPSLGDRRSTPFAEAIILEILRCSSLIYIGLMHNTMESIKFHGYDIDKDTVVFANIFAVHNDPNVWGDPENFRPERFIDNEGRVKRIHESLLSFSAGGRQCPGEAFSKDQLYLFITSIFKKYRAVPCPGEPTPTTVPLVKGFQLVPQPYNVIFEDR